MKRPRECVPGTLFLEIRAWHEFSLLGARRAGAFRAHEKARAVRQINLAPARAERAIARLIPLDAHLGAGRYRVAVPAAAHERVRRAAFDGPRLLFAAVRRDLDMQPRMRIAELHPRNDAFEHDRPVDVELRGERVVGEGGRPGRRRQQSACDGARDSTSHRLYSSALLATRPRALTLRAVT